MFSWYSIKWTCPFEDKFAYFKLTNFFEIYATSQHLTCLTIRDKPGKKDRYRKLVGSYHFSKVDNLIVIGAD